MYDFDLANTLSFSTFLIETLDREDNAVQVWLLVCGINPSYSYTVGNLAYFTVKSSSDVTHWQHLA